MVENWLQIQAVRLVLQITCHLAQMSRTNCCYLRHIHKAYYFCTYFCWLFFIIIESGLGLVRLTFRASLEESKIQNVDNFSSVLVLQKRSVLELGV